MMRPFNHLYFPARHNQSAALTLSIVRLYHLFEIAYKLLDFKHRQASVLTTQIFVSLRNVQQAKYHIVQRLWNTPPYTATNTICCTVQVVIYLRLTWTHRHNLPVECLFLTASSSESLQKTKENSYLIACVRHSREYLIGRTIQRCW